MKTQTSDMTKGVPIKVIAGHKLGDDAIAAIGATAAFYSVLIYFAKGMNNLICHIAIFLSFWQG